MQTSLYLLYCFWVVSDDTTACHGEYSECYCNKKTPSCSFLGFFLVCP